MQGNAFKICPHCRAQCPLQATNCWQCMRAFQTQFADVNRTQAFGAIGQPLSPVKPIWAQWWAWLAFFTITVCGGFTCLSLIGYSSNALATNQQAQDRAYYIGEWTRTWPQGEDTVTFNEENAYIGNHTYMWIGTPSELMMNMTINGRGRLETLKVYEVARQGSGQFIATDTDTGITFVFKRVK